MPTFTSHARASNGACSHERRTSISDGFGMRAKSETNARIVATSHKNIAPINRGDHHAGTSHTNPKSSITKKRGPNPNGNHPSGRARAPISTGIKGCCEFTGIPSLRHFHRGDDLLDHLIRGQSFQVRLWLEQNAV